ncbi:MAG: helix-turn-helix transcriptional regulator [Pseudomonadota bacterium]
MPENTVQKHFSPERLRERRIANGWTMTELGARMTLARPKDASVTKQSISLYESGLAMPGADRLAALAAAFGCLIDDLFEGVVNVERP